MMIKIIQTIRVKLFVICFILISNAIFAQDTIVLKNTNHLISKVLEISDSTILYILISSENELKYSIDQDDVEKIIYSNGQVEFFDGRIIQRIKTTTVIPVTERFYNKKDRILDRGLYLDWMIGFSQLTNLRGSSDTNSNQNNPIKTYGNTSYIHIGFRAGFKWYAGTNMKWRRGFQIQFMRYGLFLPVEKQQYKTDPPTLLSIGHAGFSNVFKFSQNLGLEVNALVGPTLASGPSSISYSGTMSIEAKLRIKKLSIGLDYQYSRQVKFIMDRDDARWNTMTISVGIKF